MENKDFDLKLVTAIQRHPSLWDKKHPRYVKRIENRPVWNQIAAGIGDGVTADDCRKRWKNLRTAYWKYRRAQATGYSKLAFELAQSMEFLAPHIEVMRQIKTESGDIRSGLDVEEDSQGSGSSDGEQESESVDPGALREIRTGRECRHLAVDADNADALFLLSMLPEMGRLSEERKRYFKIDMMILVRKYLDEG